MNINRLDKTRGKVDNFCATGFGGVELKRNKDIEKMNIQDL
jgi:hypothetical protein